MPAFSSRCLSLSGALPYSLAGLAALFRSDEINRQEVGVLMPGGLWTMHQIHVTPHGRADSRFCPDRSDEGVRPFQLGEAKEIRK